jgi:H+-transporting ATPase
MVALVFGGEARVYVVRERQHLWSSRPGTWVILASVVDVLLIASLAIRGIAMHSLPMTIVTSALAAALLVAFLLDQIKVPVFRSLQI